MNNSGKKVICYNCRGEGHVARQCKEPKRARDSQWYHDKALLIQAKEKGVVLDAEAEAFLANVECGGSWVRVVGSGRMEQDVGRWKIQATRDAGFVLGNRRLGCRSGGEWLKGAGSEEVELQAMTGNLG
nr:hypothetical protein [Tanacetum cinerariifolium]